MRATVLFIVLFTCLLSQTKAQEYLPMLGETNTWTYSAWPWNFVHTITTEDSVYNSKNYKKIIHNDEHWSKYNGLLREDVESQQVWYIEPDSLKERIIYDFSLEEGDSIFLEYNADSMGFMLNDGWYFVDSVRIKKFLGIERRVFYLDNPLNDDLQHFGSDRPYIQWIEGVGSNLHPVYFRINDCAADFCGILFVYGASVICSFQDNIHLYQDPCFFAPYVYDWTCYTSSNIDSEDSLKLLTIFPNPATNQFSLVIPSYLLNSIFKLQDISGKTYKEFVLNKTNEIIYITDLPSGIYFISVNKKNNPKIIQKLIIN